MFVVYLYMASEITIVYWTTIRGLLWTEVNSPSLGSHYLPVVCCQKLGPQDIFPLPHQHGCLYCLCSGLLCAASSMRDCFTEDFLVFWLLQSSQPLIHQVPRATDTELWCRYIHWGWNEWLCFKKVYVAHSFGDMRTCCCLLLCCAEDLMVMTSLCY